MRFFVDPGAWEENSSTISTSREEFLVPEGSLCGLGSGPHIHSDEDVRHFNRQLWLSEVSPAVSISLCPELTSETCNLPLDRQLAYVSESGCCILTPYEIAYLALLWKQKGREHLFEGRVRTQTEVKEGFSHLSLTTTVVAFYDAEGMLRFARENTGCKKDDLGVLAGIRRWSSSH